MEVKYFAYASNMAPDVMAALCPAHRFVAVARLPDHRLAFTRRSVKTSTGVADVVEAPGSSVWGVLYELPEHELGALDRKEGRGWAYGRVRMAVFVFPDEHREDAITYKVLRPDTREFSPSPQYLARIVRAARVRRLPRPYVDRLEEIMRG